MSGYPEPKRPVPGKTVRARAFRCGFQATLPGKKGAQGRDRTIQGSVPTILQRSAVNQVVLEVLDINPARQMPAVLFAGVFPDQGHNLPAAL